MNLQARDKERQQERIRAQQWKERREPARQAAVQRRPAGWPWQRAAPNPDVCAVDSIDLRADHDHDILKLVVVHAPTRTSAALALCEERQLALDTSEFCVKDWKLCIAISLRVVRDVDANNVVSIPRHLRGPAPSSMSHRGRVGRWLQQCGCADAYSGQRERGSCVRS